jgi:Ca2+-binding EF-hand superfamily protein
MCAHTLCETSIAITHSLQAVFKHYDHDRDDYISQAEFNMIAGNFPFIEPFSIIDEDR